MEENKEEKKINTEEIKNEAKSTVSEVKETIKQVNIKQDASATTNFIKDLWKDPLAKIHEIANDNSNKFFKYAIIILAVWVIAAFVGAIDSVSGLWKYTKTFKSILTIIKITIAPIVSVLVIAFIVMAFNKDKKKKLTTVLTTVITAKIPTVIARILGLLTIFSSSIYKITNILSSFLNVISIILMYFAIKELLVEEKHSNYIKKFVVIEGIFYIVYFVLTYLEIYIH